jgi:hypothetical protein
VQINKSLRAIVKVIDLMAEYNPNLLLLKISEQLDIFENRVTEITNTIQQQLHHHKLTIDLLTPEQMEIMHKAVQKVAMEEKFNSQAKKIKNITKLKFPTPALWAILLIWCMYPALKLEVS